MFNLNDKYKELNQQIFSGELPEDVPVRWTIAKRHAGVATSYFDVDGKYLESKIGINNYLKNTEKEFIETIIHEMIHVKIAMMGIKINKKESHGIRFQNEVKRINSGFPQYKISISDNQFRKIEKTKIKLQHGILIKKIDGEVLFNLYKERINRDQFLLILQLYSTLPAFDGALFYTFNGTYEHTGQMIVKRNENTLLSNFQSSKDNSYFLDFFDQTENDCEFRYKLESENKHFILRKENVFTKAVYPVFYDELAQENMEMLKMMALVKKE